MTKCHSTNDIATQILNQPATLDGTVVITDCQERGRGQRGNTWESEPNKNLTFSVILKPSGLIPQDQFYLNMVIALGVHRAISEFIKSDVFIKWPNDIIVKDRKVAGILIENHWQGSRLLSCVAGIGMNINQVEFPMSTATSVKQVHGDDVDLQEMLDVVLEQVEVLYFKLREGSTNDISQAYHRDLYLRDKEHTFHSQGNTFRGTVRRVRADGRLVVAIGDREKDFGAKEIATL